MSTPTRSELSALRERIRAIEAGTARQGPVLPFGVAEIDGALPGGGLVLGAFHEILGAAGDEEDGAFPAGFAAGILARLGGAVLWCAVRPDLYVPGLAAMGLPANRLLLARCRGDAEVLWAMEEGLRGPGLAAVLGEVETLPATAGRRLQLAGEASGVTALALRRFRSGEAASRQRAAPTAATTRWRITALPSAPVRDEPGLGTPLWHLELLRCRGGSPSSWIVEAPDATGHVRLPAALADRPSPTQESARRAGSL
jgi:protein ImuA